MKIVYFVKQYGAYSFIRILKVALRTIGIVKETVYLLELNLADADICSKVDNYDYSDVVALKLDDFKKSGNLSPKKLELFHTRYETGSYSCFGIKKNTKIVYFTWISWSQMEYPRFFNLHHALKDDEFLLFDSYCDPTERGKGYHSKMNVFRLNKALEKNKEKALVYVKWENRPALRVQYKNGFKIQKKLIITKVGRWKRLKQFSYG